MLSGKKMLQQKTAEKRELSYKITRNGYYLAKKGQILHKEGTQFCSKLSPDQSTTSYKFIVCFTLVNKSYGHYFFSNTLMIESSACDFILITESS